jgi:hypothetical protein
MTNRFRTGSLRYKKEGFLKTVAARRMTLDVIFDILKSGIRSNQTIKDHPFGMSLNEKP